VRAATLLLLLLPQVPLLFQGQEFASSAPFMFFTNHEPGLGRLVSHGRRQEFAAFRAFADPAVRAAIPDPQSTDTFERSRLDHREAEVGIGRTIWELHRELLRTRREDPVLQAYRRERLPLATTARQRSLVVTLDAGGARRWLVANFGEQLRLRLDGEVERVLLFTEDARFGGLATPPVIEGDTVLVPRHSGALLEGGS
jgi:maltooligosyltrehalose trehalohydrolase